VKRERGVPTSGPPAGALSGVLHPASPHREAGEKDGRAARPKRVATKLLRGPAERQRAAKGHAKGHAKAFQLDAENAFLRQQIANLAEALAANERRSDDQGSKLKEAESTITTLTTEKVLLETDRLSSRLRRPSSGKRLLTPLLRDSTWPSSKLSASSRRLTTLSSLSNSKWWTARSFALDHLLSYLHPFVYKTVKTLYAYIKCHFSLTVSLAVHLLSFISCHARRTSNLFEFGMNLYCT